MQNALVLMFTSMVQVAIREYNSKTILSQSNFSFLKKINFFISILRHFISEVFMKNGKD